MAAYINTNTASLFAQKSLNSSQNQLQVSMQRLSSGLRINSAKDDATGLVNGTKLDSQVRGSNQAIRNANDGISSSQTNDGYMAQVTENLQRMRELAVQSNGTLVLANSEEGTALVAENTRILALAVDITNVVVNADGGTVTAVGAKPTLGAVYTVAGIDADIGLVNTSRAGYGADMATFESAINNLQTSSVNLSAAKSRIMDTDYAAESAQMTRNSILQQAGTAMLAQANQLPNTVLKLLQ
jgi:flagellin